MGASVMNNAPNPNVKLVAGVALAVAAVGAYVYLKSHTLDVQELFIFLGPLVTYLLIGSKVEAETNKQNTKLDKIDAQTNGILDKRIKDAVHAVLDERENDGK